MKPEYYLLSPKILTKADDKSYAAVEELSEVIQKEGCNNIALTGTFGSGKSSILKTLKTLECHRETKFLNISLATLDKGPKEIEYSILQQLIYKADAKAVSQSRFKKIQCVDSKQERNYILYILGFIVAFFIAVEPSWLRVNAFYELFNSIFNSEISYYANIILDIIATGYMLFCAYFVIKFVLERLYNSRIHKFNLKEGAVEITKDASAFNQHLDEIVYFFESTKYDVVVFEDLDRFENPRHIFLKLREINTLINDLPSSDKAKCVRFIYAIKDEVFTGEERTKYFDYIVSAIPVVNAINSGDFLIKTYGNNTEFNISKKQWIELGAYIGGMRELRNIVNEFIQYKNQVGEKLEDHKLFAMTIYKNKYPEDYAKLHCKSGVLYNSIHKKSKYITHATSHFKLQLNELRNKKSEVFENIVAIRQRYIDGIKQQIDIDEFISDGQHYSLDKVIREEPLFNKLCNNNYKEYYAESLGTNHQYTLDFANIEEQVDPDMTYLENVATFEDGLKSIKSEIDAINTVITTITKSSIAKILHLCDSNVILEEICGIYKTEYPSMDQEDKSMCRIILFLLRNGYIDEHYNNFISYFHSGSLTDSDYAYFQNITLGISCGYDYTLQNVDNLLSMIAIDYYDKQEILVYELLDGVISKLPDRQNELDKIIHVVKTDQLIDFIIGYDGCGKYKANFFELLLSRWSDYLTITFNVDNIEVQVKLLLIFYKYCPVSACNDFINNVEQLGDNYSVLADNITSLNFEKAAKILLSMRVPFTTLEHRDEASKLYSFVLDRSLYAINAHNLNLVLGAEFKTKAYSTILNCSNKNIVKYLQANIEQVVSLFPNTSINESQEGIVGLLNNTNISEELKTSYLKKQNLIIDQLQGFEAQYEHILFDADHIKPMWDNIIDHYIHSGNKLTDSLAQYIERQYDVLQKETAIYRKGESNPTGSLFSALFANNDLPLNIYQAIIGCFNISFQNTDLSDLDEERMLILIRKNKIKYVTKNITTLSSKFLPRIFADFLIANFDAFLKDEENEIEINNEVGVYILRSELTLNQKISFLNSMEDEMSLPDDNYAEAYANEICFYYAEAGIDDNSNVNVIDEALGWASNWLNKIRVINAVNASRSYNRSHVTNMIDMLGNEYKKLNQQRKRPRFDNNAENYTLIKFLMDNGHISSWDPQEKHIDVVSLYPKN